jgi:hypothetical protein
MGRRERHGHHPATEVGDDVSVLAANGVEDGRHVVGGPRYAVALAVDALGTGLLRPFLLLYGVTVLGLSAPVTGTAMTAGVVAGLVCVPAVGRWLDRGARGTVVAASMLVRVLGVSRGVPGTAADNDGMR